MSDAAGVMEAALERLRDDELLFAPQLHREWARKIADDALAEVRALPAGDTETVHVPLRLARRIRLALDHAHRDAANHAESYQALASELVDTPTYPVEDEPWDHDYHLIREDLEGRLKAAEARLAQIAELLAGCSDFWPDDDDISHALRLARGEDATDG